MQSLSEFLDQLQYTADVSDKLIWYEDNLRQVVGWFADITDDDIREEHFERLTNQFLGSKQKTQIAKTLKELIKAELQNRVKIKINKYLPDGFDFDEHKIHIGKNGIQYNPHSAVTLLQNDIFIDLCYDSFRDRIYLLNPPWPCAPGVEQQTVNYPTGESTTYCVFNKHGTHYAALKDHLNEAFFRAEAGFGDLMDVVNRVAGFKQINTLQDIILSMEGMTGQEDLINSDNNWVVQVLKPKMDTQEDKEWTKEIARIIPLSIVWRALDPGCIMRTTVVLEGPQEIGKTQFVRTLAFDTNYFGSVEFTGNNLNMRELTKRIVGKVVVEIPEFARNSAVLDQQKNFLSEQENTDRKHYSDNYNSPARQSIFMATTNHEIYLSDQTGNSRYGPLAIEGQIDLELFNKLRVQIFAQAIALYRQGEQPFFKDKDLQQKMLRPREVQTEQYDWITEYCESHPEQLKTGVMMKEIYEWVRLNIETNKPMRTISTHLRAFQLALHKHGFSQSNLHNKDTKWYLHKALWPGPFTNQDGNPYPRAEM